MRMVFCLTLLLLGAAGCQTGSDLVFYKSSTLSAQGPYFNPELKRPPSVIGTRTTVRHSYPATGVNRPMTTTVFTTTTTSPDPVTGAERPAVTTRYSATTRTPDAGKGTEVPVRSITVEKHRRIQYPKNPADAPGSAYKPFFYDTADEPDAFTETRHAGRPAEETYEVCVPSERPVYVRMTRHGTETQEGTNKLFRSSGRYSFLVDSEGLSTCVHEKTTEP